MFILHLLGIPGPPQDYSISGTESIVFLLRYYLNTLLGFLQFFGREKKAEMWIYHMGEWRRELIDQLTREASNGLSIAPSVAKVSEITGDF